MIDGKSLFLSVLYSNVNEWTNRSGRGREIKKMKTCLFPVFAFIACVCVGGDASGAGAVEAHMDLHPQEIAGIALFPDGETPVSDLPVRVWDMAEKKFVYRTRTDEHGVFEAPQMGAGLHSLFVGRVKIDLCMIAEKAGRSAQRHDIIVVIPRKMIVSARPGLMDVLVAPAFFRPPEPARVVSP